MELHQVTAFLAVAEHLHFGRAAESLTMAQPHLSRTIRQLEGELGSKLFDRTTRRVELTEFGRLMFPSLQAISMSVSDAKQTAALARTGGIGRVRIGYGGISSHQAMGELASLVRTEQPSITLEIEGTSFGVRALELVSSGELDLAIVRTSSALSGVSTKVIGHEHLILAVPEGHYLATSASVRLRDLAQEPFITLPEEQGSALAQALSAHSHHVGFTPEIVQVAPDSRVAMVFVAAGLGLSLTVTSVRDQVRTPGVVFVPLADDLPPLDINLAWRTNNANPALKVILDLVSRVSHFHPNGITSPDFSTGDAQ